MPAQSPTRYFIAQENEHSESYPSVGAGGRDARPEHQYGRGHCEIVRPGETAMGASGSTGIEDAGGPIQTSAASQMAVRAGTPANSPATTRV